MEGKDYIYLFGIFVTFVLSVWNSIQVHRTTRKTRFVNTVTTQRVIWIEQIRQDVARFVGLTHTWVMSCVEGQDNEVEMLKEIDRLRHVILLRLNPVDAPDKEIASLVRRIPELTHDSKRDELLAALEDLTTATQLMLKEEWEKVKREAKAGELK